MESDVCFPGCKHLRITVLPKFPRVGQDITNFTANVSDGSHKGSRTLTNLSTVDGVAGQYYWSYPLDSPDGAGTWGFIKKGNQGNIDVFPTRLKCYKKAHQDVDVEPDKIHQVEYSQSRWLAGKTKSANLRQKYEQLEHRLAVSGLAQSSRAKIATEILRQFKKLVSDCEDAYRVLQKSLVYLPLPTDINVRIFDNVELVFRNILACTCREFAAIIRHDKARWTNGTILSNTRRGAIVSEVDGETFTAIDDDSDIFDSDTDARDGVGHFKKDCVGAFLSLTLLPQKKHWWLK